MNSGVARKLTLLWMLATTAHLPVPVWDGDCPPAAAASPLTRLLELVDFVRLGCRASSELEDYPFEHDPAGGNTRLGMFPAYLAAREVESNGSADWLAPIGIERDSLLCGCEPAIPGMGTGFDGRTLDRHFRAGGRLLPVMRC